MKNQDPNVYSFTSNLRARGHALLPVPRHVGLTDRSVTIDAKWGLRLAGTKSNSISARTLLAGLRDGHNLTLSPTATRRRLELVVRPRAVSTGCRDRRDDEAYRLDITPNLVRLTGNTGKGLFYAIQTLLQLLNGNAHQRCVLPEGTIIDWPEYELRCLHWDTKHHQDRPETLRRYLDQAAAFKVNAVILEIEDKFEYPSHPVIGAPGAFTTAELQSLVNYGLERFIQIIPNVQGPGHMAYVLKHKEFAHLRCDGSNYQICMDLPEARKLVFDMYDDLCKATRGVEFFHVSTDEVYYAGICEKFRKPYNPENRSLTWVDFVNAAHAHLSKKGRRVIVWAEYPLLPKHVPLLPPTLLNGVGGRGGLQTQLEDKQGIRRFLITGTQGVELLFPNYFAYTDRDGSCQPGRLEGVRNAYVRGDLPDSHFIGTILAAWDDSGPHGETFWLGWAFGAQGGWLPGISVEETVASFMDVFYGPEADGMTDVYHSLQAGARFFEFTLERLPSKLRGPAYGDWDGKRPVPRTDRAMIPPALPHPKTLTFKPVFSTRYAQAIANAPARLVENDRLILKLQSNLTRVRRNRHSIEVFLSLAYLQRHFIRTLLAVAGAENVLIKAADLAKKREHKQAARLLLDARKRIAASNDDLYRVYEELRTTWEKSRFPKGRSVNSRQFVHVMDDVKDHLGDRRPDLTYIISPIENIGLAAWLKDFDEIIDSYVNKHGLGTRQQVQRDPEE
ncbi:MAG: hypothetical protein C0404_11450 [Verrucomicrobia bacterium]|nr:hypothetical protein [Verrucomicrobiota bacterium]